MGPMDWFRQLVVMTLNIHQIYIETNNIVSFFIPMFSTKAHMNIHFISTTT